MKLILEVKDNKVDFLIELLKNFSFVKNAKLLSEEPNDFQQAIEELNLAKQGRLKTRPLGELLNEL